MHLWLFSHLISAIVVSTNLLQVQAQFYLLSTCYIGDDFLNPHDFTFFTAADPTAGRVTYVDSGTAAADNLTFATDDVFIMRADDTTVLTADDPGRKSVRITSVATFGSPSAIVFDIAHMPEGCGTWPAFWTFGPNWPLTGEIDIMEGVNNQNFNQATLHTGPNCTMGASRPQTGTILNNDCAAADDYNEGCGVEFASGTFGPTFNANGGGWFGMERTSDAIRIWFWARDDITVPIDVAYGLSIVDTDIWGTPVASFLTSSTCDLATEFAAHNIVINLTFCGDFAGAASIWDESCAVATGVAQCNDYVDANPSAFTNAYFEINAVRVYQ